MANGTGDVTLGALLGQNQSFEGAALGPWSKVSNQASAYIVASASAVHSSTFGLYTVTGSSGDTATAFACTLGTPDVAGRSAFPGIGSHAVWCSVWGRAADAPSSGRAAWRVTGNANALSAPFAYGAALQRYGAATVTGSPSGLLEIALDRVTAAGTTASFAVDDVLTQIDPIVLHPEWTLEDRSALLQAQHRTQSGRLAAVAWGRYRGLNLPLRSLSGLEAGLINWWWELQAPLAFTLDSSDAAAVWVCRIANPRQPVGRRIRPYADRWSGSLTLESLDEGSLVY
jgi:hypothetical protein